MKIDGDAVKPNCILVNTNITQKMSGIGRNMLVRTLWIKYIIEC